MKLTTAGRVAKNSIAMMGASLTRRATNFVIYILIARFLGVLIFGRFSLVYSLYIIFQVPAMYGLGNLIVREVAKNKSDFDKYLINGHLIVLISSLTSLGLWALLVHLLGYSPQVLKASYLLGLALIPFAMCKVCEATFKAFERMQYIVYAFALADLVKIGLVWWFLSMGFGLMNVLGLLVIVQMITLLLEWYFIYRYFPKPSWTIDLSFCRKTARVATTFLGISVFSIVFLRLNVIILSKLRGELEVGLYNAAFQLTGVFMLLTVSLWDAVYPVLSRTFMEDLVRFKRYAEHSIEFLLSIALPLAVSFFFMADVVLLVYGEEFVAAAPVMRLLGWVLVPMCFSTFLGGVLQASEQQRANLTILVVNSAALFVLSIVLIYKFGLIGAGGAVLASCVLSFLLHYRIVSRKVIPISILRVVWRPVVSSLFLAGFLLLISRSQGLLVVIPSAIVFYGTVLLGLNLLFSGPLRSVSALGLWSKSVPRVQGTKT